MLFAIQLGALCFTFTFTSVDCRTFKIC